MRRLICLIMLLVCFSGLASCPDPHTWLGLGSNSTTTAARTYSTTATYLPSPDALCLAMVVSDAAATNFSGNGMTWSKIAQTNYNTLGSPASVLQVWRGSAHTPSRTLGQATFATTRGGCIIRVVQIANAAVIRQTVYGGANASANPAITLAAISNPGSNSVVAFFANDQNGFSGAAEAGWTEDYDAGHNAPAEGGYVVYQLATSDNSVAVTSGSADWAGVAFEVDVQNCPGTINAVVVDTNGWTSILTFAGGDTNGSFEIGLGPINSITANTKFKIALTSQGFDDTGTAITVPRTIYGTKGVRFAYPGQAYPDAVVSGGNVTVKVANSDFIYAGDSNLTATVLPNLYMTGPTMATNIAMANYSAMNYPPVIGNWTWPGFNLVTNTLRLRCVAFHKSAQEGRPVRAVKFWAVDQHSHGATNIQTTMRIDHTLPDKLPTAEYFADLDVSGFSSGDLITCNAIAYPWIGNTPLDFGAYGQAFPTSYPCYQTNVCDNAGTFGITRALVATNGNDTTGIAANATYWATNQTPQPFATIGRAVIAITGTNNSSYSRNNPGGGIIYLCEGTHGWLGSTVTLSGTEQTTWCEVRAYTNNATIGEAVTDGVGLADKDKYHIVGLPYVSTTQTHSRTHVWNDNCTIQATGAGFFSTSSANIIWYLTHCRITNLTQGIQSQAAQHLMPALVRGNDLTGFSKKAVTYTMIGNEHRTGGGGDAVLVVTDVAGQTAEVPNPICYNNAFYGTASAGSVLLAGQNFDMTNGAVFAQNIFENYTNTSLSSFSLYDNENHVVTNLMYWNNLIVGGRTLSLYNSTGTNALWKTASLKNNIHDDDNIKTDTFTTASGGRTGNWSVVYGVAHSGNVDLCTTNIGTPISFMRGDATVLGFEGIGCYAYFVATALASTTNYPAWVSRLAYDGIQTMPGDGNYRLKSNTPLGPELMLYRDQVLPYDLEGNGRGGFDPPGAYSSASPRKGAGFFQ